MQLRKSKGRQAIEMFSTHRSSLAVVYQIAVVLRMIITNQKVQMHDACPVRVIAHKEDDVVPVSADKATAVLTILSPPPSFPQQALTTILCGISAAVHKARCITNETAPDEVTKKKETRQSFPMPDDDATLDLA